MAIKITAFLVTLLINAVAGVVLFFFMLMGMNGFNESDAQYGLVAYIILATVVTLLMGAVAAVLIHVLLKRNFGKVAAAMIAIPVFSLIGFGLEFVSCIAGILIAEFVRVNY